MIRCLECKKEMPPWRDAIYCSDLCNCRSHLPDSIIRRQQKGFQNPIVAACDLGIIAKNPRTGKYVIVNNDVFGGKERVRDYSIE